ncbi:MAG: ATP-binding protein [Ruminococcus sp.]|nr:ATP-binding protein [Ruminococcus sp.]
MNDKLQRLELGLGSLVIFRELLEDDVIKKLRRLIHCEKDEPAERISAYSSFVSALYANTVNLSEYILKLVIEDENFYITGKAAGVEFDQYIESALENDLKILQMLSQVSSGTLSVQVGYYGFLPSWKTADIDFMAEYSWRIENVSRFGYGKWAQNTMFDLCDGRIEPVACPDPQKLSELFGYERERVEVINNTLALLHGKPAQNVLLYGDAGTGKSSTVKAIVNEYADMGLRLIELSKDELSQLPAVISEISSNPLKFIIFIDDLTFRAGEDCFGALKAALEGSASARTDNMAIYATSNRRHLIKESFSDREGDDVHRNDTIQEMISLSARFGLRVNFGKPDKNSYLSIVRELAGARGISMDTSELELRAEQFAVQSGNGRSPRTAKQFVDTITL